MRWNLPVSACSKTVVRQGYADVSFCSWRPRPCPLRASFTHGHTVWRHGTCRAERCHPSRQSLFSCVHVCYGGLKTHRLLLLPSVRPAIWQGTFLRMPLLCSTISLIHTFLLHQVPTFPSASPPLPLPSLCILRGQSACKYKDKVRPCKSPVVVQVTDHVPHAFTGAPPFQPPPPRFQYFQGQRP